MSGPALCLGYVDAMIERGRDTDNNGTLDERQYVQQDANYNVTSITSSSGSVLRRAVQVRP